MVTGCSFRKTLNSRFSLRSERSSKIHSRNSGVWELVAASFRAVDGEEDRHGKALDASVGCMNISNLTAGHPFDVIFQHGERQDPNRTEVSFVESILQ